MIIIALGKPCIRGRELSTTISFRRIFCMSMSTFLPCRFCSNDFPVSTVGNPIFRESCRWNNAPHNPGTPSPSLCNHHIDACLARGVHDAFHGLYSRHFVSMRHRHRKNLRKFAFWNSEVRSSHQMTNYNWNTVYVNKDFKPDNCPISAP